MTKVEARSLFIHKLGWLIRIAEDLGILFLITCFHRSDKEQAQLYKEGKSKVVHSQHQDWLAVDIVLINRCGELVWEHKAGDDYERLGDAWKKGHRCARWGGDFGRTDERLGWDPYHFELAKEILV